MQPAGEARIASDLRSADALVFVDDLTTPVIAEHDAHHLIDVLRLRSGATIALGDGEGRWRRGVIADVTSPTRHRSRGTNHASMKVVVGSLGEIVERPLPGPSLCVAFAIPKGDRFDLIVQKLTELGIDSIVPVITRRTVVRVESKADLERRRERATRIAREAASQSRRLCLPVVHEPQPLGRFLAEHAGGVAVAEPGGSPLTVTTNCVLVGPEGGWDEQELPGAIAKVGFGPTILRAETAAITAGVLLSAIRSGVIAHG